MRKRLFNTVTLSGFGSLLLAILPYFEEGAKMNATTWALLGIGMILVLWGMLKPKKHYSFPEMQDIVAERAKYLSNLKDYLSQYIVCTEDLAKTNDCLYDLDSYINLYFKYKMKWVSNVLKMSVKDSSQLLFMKLYGQLLFMDNLILRQIVDVNPEAQELLRKINSCIPYIPNKKLRQCIQGVAKASHVVNSYQVFGKLINKYFEDMPRRISKTLQRGDDVSNQFRNDCSSVYRQIDELLRGDDLE